MNLLTISTAADSQALPLETFFIQISSILTILALNFDKRFLALLPNFFIHFHSPEEDIEIPNIFRK